VALVREEREQSGERIMAALSDRRGQPPSRPTSKKPRRRTRPRG